MSRQAERKKVSFSSCDDPVKVLGYFVNVLSVFVVYVAALNHKESFFFLSCLLLLSVTSYLSPKIPISCPNIAANNKFFISVWDIWRLRSRGILWCINHSKPTLKLLSFRWNDVEVSESMTKNTRFPGSSCLRWALVIWSQRPSCFTYNNNNKVYLYSPLKQPRGWPKCFTIK